MMKIASRIRDFFVLIIALLVGYISVYKIVVTVSSDPLSSIRNPSQLSHDTLLEILVLAISLLLITLILDKFQTFSKLDEFLGAVGKNKTFSKLDEFLSKTEQNNTIDNIKNTHSSITTLEERYPRISALFAIVQGHRQFYSIVFKYALRHKSETPDDKTFRVFDSQISADVWRECILESKNWEALTYAKNAWGQGDPYTSQISKECQEFNIKRGKRITRIFIFDTESERQEYTSVMEEQKRIGVEVFYILKQKLIENNESVHKILTELSWDFSIVDDDTNDYLFVFNLNKENKIEGFTLTIEETFLKRAKQAFEVAKKIATQFR
jgi:hypothetical protein